MAGQPRDVQRLLNRKVRYAVQDPGPKVDRRVRMGRDEWSDTGRRAGVKSSWCRAIRYAKERKALYVTFKDGFTARYDGVSTALARKMYQAGSMGKFVHKFLYHWPYSDASKE